MDGEMYCEKCGSIIESDDIFCPMCGNRVSKPGAIIPRTIAQTEVASKRKHTVGNGALIKDARKNTKKAINSAADVTNRLILSALGFIMLCCTFFPFVSIKTGTIGNIAGAIIGRNIGNIQPNLYGVKAAVIGLRGVLKSQKVNSLDQLNNILNIAIVFVLAVAILAMLSGLINNKGFVLTSGIASILCLGMWIAYVIYVRSISDQMNGYLGEYASVDFHGIGMTMLIIVLAAHAFLAIRRAAKM